MPTPYKDKMSRISKYLILFSLFFLGFNIPKFSISTVLIILPIILLTVPRSNFYLNKSDLLNNFLLLAFSTSFYTISWIYGYIGLIKGISYILSIQCFYLLGHYSFHFFKQKDNELKIVMPVIFLALGFSVYVFTLTLIESIDTKSFFILSRKIPNQWGHYLLPATLISVYSSFGISLLPLGIKLLIFPAKTKRIILLILTIFFMGSTGLIAAFMLSNRSTFFLLACLFTSFMIYFLYLDFKENETSWTKCILAMSVLFSCIYIFFFSDLSFLAQYDVPLLKRFSINNLGESRAKLWCLAIKHLATNFWGGKTYALDLPLSLNSSNTIFWEILHNKFGFLYDKNFYQSIYYKNFTTFYVVHNLWLDIHYAAGALPFCLLIIFQLMHIKSFLSLIFNDKIKIIAITTIGIATATLVYFMIEPIMTSCVRFFIGSCFLLAYLQQVYKSTNILTRKNII